MIDRTHELPVVRQCQVLALSRSTTYYQPQPVSGVDLARMRWIDEWHLVHPFAGARMLSRMLRREGDRVGRRHVATLMKRMGIHALYRKPNTSKRHPAHKVYPLSAAQSGDHSTELGLGSRHHLQYAQPTKPACQGLSCLSMSGMHGSMELMWQERACPPSATRRE